MKITSKKTQMLYKNESGGRIILTVVLPYADSECQLNCIYRSLCEKYFVEAKKFIDRKSTQESFVLKVSFETLEVGKILKIKRVLLLKNLGNTVLQKVSFDYFTKEDLKLKK